MNYKQYYRLVAIILFLGQSFLVTAQQGSDDSKVLQNLQRHISTLASNEYEGRESGSEGEKKAYQYISGQFQSIGLQPAGTEGYLQPFPFTAAGEATDANSLIINKKKFELEADFFPLSYSANKKASGPGIKAGYGIIAPGRNDYNGLGSVKGKILIMEYGNPEGMHPHSKMAELSDIGTRIDSAIAKGAAGIVFINSDKDQDDPKFDYSRRYTSKDIPVIFAKGMAFKTLSDGSSWKISMNSEIIRERKTAYNVAGFINNESKHTVVIGAHYDHLGYGAEGSLYRGEPDIHNGADDNASGTALLIELARYLDLSNLDGNNYLFIAFSGEEKGLLGSGYYVKNPTKPLESFNYMLNMDMVGRLDSNKRVLIINGVGTSPVWKDAIESIHIDSVDFKTTDSGVGPSDHTSFYLKDIPSIHFFTGTHPDYHKPSDDENLINYRGELSVMKIMIALVEDLDNDGELAFTKTSDSDNENAPRFKVTLGVVPDYAFEGSGMRIDGVSDDKPAQKAGMQAGDIITALGDNNITDMMSYMKALSKYAKGDLTKVKFIRDGQLMEADIEF